MEKIKAKSSCFVGAVGKVWKLIMKLGIAFKFRWKD